MSEATFHCPQCQSSLKFPAPVADGAKVRCPKCEFVFTKTADLMEQGPGSASDWDEGAVPPQPGRKVGIILGVLLIFLIGSVAACAGLIYFIVTEAREILPALPGLGFEAEAPPLPDEDYADARKTFRTRLLDHGPAPQEWHPLKLPSEAREVQYPSGDLRLKAWVSRPRGEGKSPAVLFVHGGYAFDLADWDMAEPFRDAGFVVMTPMLRGENGQPGDFSFGYDELDDVLAAAEHLAGLPNVDPDRLYVAGHHIGGNLALLAAMASPKFKAAASLCGYPDAVAFAKQEVQIVGGGEANVLRFDTKDVREFQMRSPRAYSGSLRCPARLFVATINRFNPAAVRQNQLLALEARSRGKDVICFQLDGDEMTSVPAAMQLCIRFFQTGK